MRLAFAILALGVLAVTAWVLWDDRNPEWRGYQKELNRREIVRLEEELAAARAELEGPAVQAELRRLEARRQASVPDSALDRLADLRDRLAGAEHVRDDLRAVLRTANRGLTNGPLSSRRTELTELLNGVQESYAAATGAWPPDTLRLAELWAVRDSLAGELMEIEEPVLQLRAAYEAKRAEVEELRLAVRSRTSARDSLDAERQRLLAPVAAREAALGRLRRRELRVREIVSPDGRDVARCPTCHGAIDDPPGAHPPLPSADVFARVPCTVCHRGSGRALDVEGAHRGLLAGGGFGAGPRSLRARIDLLGSRDPSVRRAALEELWALTGADPVALSGAPLTAADEDSATAALWAQWWMREGASFEPGDDGDGREESTWLAAGIDPWLFSSRGRPLRYVGSRECLGCHEVQHREHSRRWLATKFRSIERLVDEEDPAPCLECHTTGYDPATGLFAEPGVTCEGCHGPGERYNEMMVVGQELIGQGEDLRGHELLDRSSRLAREAVSLRTVPGDYGAINLCVRCHHPRRHRERGPGVLERVDASATGETG